MILVLQVLDTRDLLLRRYVTGRAKHDAIRRKREKNHDRHVHRNQIHDRKPIRQR